MNSFLMQNENECHARCRIEIFKTIQVFLEFHVLKPSFLQHLSMTSCSSSLQKRKIQLGMHHLEKNLKYVFSCFDVLLIHGCSKETEQR